MARSLCGFWMPGRFPHGGAQCGQQARASGSCAEHERWAAKHPFDPRAQQIAARVARAREVADARRTIEKVVTANVVSRVAAAQRAAAASRSRPRRPAKARPVAAPAARGDLFDTPPAPGYVRVVRIARLEP